MCDVKLVDVSQESDGFGRWAIGRLETVRQNRPCQFLWIAGIKRNRWGERYMGEQSVQLWEFVRVSVSVQKQHNVASFQRILRPQILHTAYPQAE